MRIFYDAGDVVDDVFGSPKKAEDEGETEGKARAQARAETKSELRQRRGRGSTLVAGRKGGLASANIPVQRSTLGGA